MRDGHGSGHGTGTRAGSVSVSGHKTKAGTETMVSPGSKPGLIMDLVDMELDMDRVNVGDGNEPDVREKTGQVIGSGTRAKLYWNFPTLPHFTFKFRKKKGAMGM